MRSFIRVFLILASVLFVPTQALSASEERVAEVIKILTSGLFKSYCDDGSCVQFERGKRMLYIVHVPNSGFKLMVMSSEDQADKTETHFFIKDLDGKGIVNEAITKSSSKVVFEGKKERAWQHYEMDTEEYFDREICKDRGGWKDCRKPRGSQYLPKYQKVFDETLEEFLVIARSHQKKRKTKTP